MFESLSPVPITAAMLRERVAGVPRVSLAKLPTPLDETPRFSAALGGPRILIKREDLTGLAFGGNKTRMLEFRMANALREGADCIINGAAVQSNDCRQTAAAGAKLGLKVYLVLKERRDRPDAHPQGNFLLDKLLGAEVITIGADESVSQQQVILELADRLRSEGHHPYLSLQDLHLWAVGYGALLWNGKRWRQVATPTARFGMESIAQRVAERAFNAATALLAVSDGVAQYLERFPVTLGKVHVVPNGVNPDRFPACLTPTFPAPAGTLTVGFVGTMKPWHGLGTLLDGFARLHERCPRSRLMRRPRGRRARMG